MSVMTIVTVKMAAYPDPDVYEVESTNDVFISGGGVLSLVNARGAMFEAVETHHIAPHAWVTVDVVCTPQRPAPADPGRYSLPEFRTRRWFK